MNIYRDRYLIVILIYTACFFQISCKQRESTIEKSIALANHNLDIGNINQAINLLEELNYKYPGMAIILEPLAFAYADKKDNIRAAFYFMELAEIDKLRKHYFIYAAKSFIQGGDLRGSVNAYNLYLEKFPYDQAIWKSLGNIYTKLKDPNNAIESYLQSFKLKPNGNTATHLGRLFHQMGNLIQAKNWYQSGLDLMSNNSREPLLGLIKISLEQKDYSTAEQWLNKIDDEYPNFLDTSHLFYARQELRTWRERQGKLKKTLVEQNQITEEIRGQHLLSKRDSDRNSLLSHTIEAQTLIAKNQETDGSPENIESARIFNEFPNSVIIVPPVLIDKTQEIAKVLIPPPTSKSLLQEARELKASADYKASIVKYRQSLALNDRAASTWNELSEALELDGQLRYAEATSLEAIRRDTLNITYTHQLLHILSQDENLFRYFRELKNAKDKFYSSPELTLSLARGYNNIVNNRHKSLDLYKEFLEMAPNHPQWQKANLEFMSLTPTP